MTAPSTATFADLLALDHALEAAGHHPLTPWWRATLEQYYASGVPTFVGRVGRGGTKSHVSCKVALTEVLYGSWRVPPGEVHYWAFASLSKDEAAQRIRVIKSFLDALRIKYEAAGDTIEIPELRRGFKVFAAQIGSVSGFRCFGYSADELAKWTSGADYVNPAGEVCASLNAQTVTHPGARRLLISSPFGTADYHAEAFARGTNGDQFVARATTFEANPSVDEAEVRRKEPDSRYFEREYLAEPSSVENSCFDAGHVNAAFDLPAGEVLSKFITLDPSKLRGDEFAIGVWQETREGGLSLIHTEGHRDPGVHTVINRIVALAREHGAVRVFSDDCEVQLLERELGQAGLDYRWQAWSVGSKKHAIMTARRAFKEGLISLPNDSELRRQLLTLKTRITPSGNEVTDCNGRDRAALLLCAFHAVDEGHVKCPGALPNAVSIADVNFNDPGVQQTMMALHGYGSGDSALAAPHYDGMPYDWALGYLRRGRQPPTF